jgi:hypothetical protein
MQNENAIYSPAARIGRGKQMGTRNNERGKSLLTAPPVITLKGTLKLDKAKELERIKAMREKADLYQKMADSLPSRCRSRRIRVGTWLSV